ncbi:hypothetical protein [Streptomyces tagetis]|uniref:Lipoprotein n=1 Tax=Streptomyces tagetis TaxID=2820809 RepID=A0A940XLY3_9ACTN|nr:hypothetical protein [Streptomyces sp. RG38]MBQ0829502.1 hypothetical protein [Streptomyces sp. RG38]
MRRTPLVVLCLAATAALTVAGCQSDPASASASPSGSGKSAQSEKSETSEKSGATRVADPFDGLSAAEIADRAFKATREAGSLRMRGDVPDEETGGTIRIDMAVDRDGRCAGTMSLDGEGKTELIRTGDTLYMKYDERFLRAQSEGEPAADVDAAVALLADQWTKTSAAGEDAKDAGGLCDLDAVLGEAEPAGTGLTRGESADVDGRQAVVLHEKDGADRHTVYVAAEGKPYVLRLDSESAKEPGTLTFSAYDEPVSAEAPTGKVIDLDALDG